MRFAAKIRALLAKRRKGTTICPSEILPRAEKSLKARMGQVRRSAIRLALSGEIEITQAGRKVNPENFRGPIRLRLPRGSR